MAKTEHGNVALLITGYNNNKGYSEVISCSDRGVEEAIKSQEIALKDYRFSLNVKAEGERIYSVGFAKNWRIYSIYIAYGWSARKVMIGLSLLVHKDYEFSNKESIQERLDSLQQKHILIENYQLSRIIPVDAASIQGGDIEKTKLYDGRFHSGKYHQEHDGRVCYKYQGDLELNNIFQYPYAPPFKGCREVFLINRKVEYIEPLVRKLPDVTPGPISRTFTFRFTTPEGEFSALSGFKVNGEEITGSPMQVQLTASDPDLQIDLTNDQYELKHPVILTIQQLLNQEEDLVHCHLPPPSNSKSPNQEEDHKGILLKYRLYDYTLYFTEKATKRGIPNLRVKIEYSVDGKPIKKMDVQTNDSGIYILEQLHWGQQLRFTLKVKKQKEGKRTFLQKKLSDTVQVGRYNESTCPIEVKEPPEPEPKKHFFWAIIVKFKRWLNELEGIKRIFVVSSFFLFVLIIYWGIRSVNSRNNAQAVSISEINHKQIDSIELSATMDSLGPEAIIPDSTRVDSVITDSVSVPSIPEAPVSEETTSSLSQETNKPIISEEEQRAIELQNKVAKYKEVIECYVKPEGCEKYSEDQLEEANAELKKYADSTENNGLSLQEKEVLKKWLEDRVKNN